MRSEQRHDLSGAKVITTRCCLLAVGLAFLCASDLTGEERSARPNVLFLISDDLNNDLGCYGHPLVRSPNIDALAARGTRFERAYCQYPVCGASRNSMLTGLYPNSTGILANSLVFRQTIPGHLSLPHALRLDGYHVSRAGKLYHYGVPGTVGTSGTDDPASWEITVNPAGVDRMQELPITKTLREGSFGGTLSWYASPASAAEHTDTLLADEAILLLERYAARPEQPFFLGVGFFRPHTPYTSPQEFFDLYDRNAMPVHPVEPREGVPAAAYGSRKREQDQLTDDVRREIVQAYYASVSYMDAQVGRVVAALDRLGLADNTVIVFTSDHGYHLGEHGLWQKSSLFEGSARVPLIVAAAGVGQAGSVCKTPVALLDLYPTLSELCGITRTPENLQGQSLVPMLHDPQTPGRGWGLTQVIRRSGGKTFDGYSLRTLRYRFTEWDAGEQGTELYDYDLDPEESNNLAEDSEYAELARQLSEQLKRAVSASTPPDGLPKVDSSPTGWYPNLTDPSGRGF